MQDSAKPQAGGQAGPGFQRYSVLALNIHATTVAGAASRIGEWIGAKKKDYVLACSVNDALACHDSAELAGIVNGAGLAVPDGMPLVWVGKGGGKTVERVYGPDLMLEVCRQGVASGRRHFLYGGTPAVLEQLEKKLSAQFPGIVICGRHSPPFSDLSVDEKKEIAGLINAAKPDIVWVGLGAPKQVRWIGEFRAALDAPVLAGVGAAFDFHAGTLRQAPRWMMRCGLEWLFRLLMEPRRLWRRYLLGNPRFVFLLAKQTLAGNTTEPLLAFAVFAAAFLLFHLVGRIPGNDGTTSSVFTWIGRQWTEAGGDFSNGWIMPLVSLAVIWRNRRKLAEAEKRVCPPGLLVLVAGLLMQWAAIRAEQPRVSLVAFVVVLWSIPLFIYGRAVAAILLFPAGYVLLSFTSYFLLHVSFQLRLVTSWCSAAILNGIGIASLRHGTAIFSGAGGGFNFDVADPCSGLRSLVVMTALAAPYACFTQKTVLKKWVLFLLSAPLAMLANVIRIVSVAIVAQAIGHDTALKIYHDFSGYVVFAAAVLLLTAAGGLVGLDWKEKTRKWKESVRTLTQAR